MSSYPYAPFLMLIHFTRENEQSEGIIKLTAVTDLVLIYKSVTSSAFAIHGLTLYSWTLNFCILLRPNDWTLVKWTELTVSNESRAPL
jgi:hypothetical protein